MGWVSYREDLQERISDALNSLDREFGTGVLNVESTGELENRRFAEGIARLKADIEATINKLLDEATDPSVDIAQKNKALEQELEKQSDTLEQVNSKLSHLKLRHSALVEESKDKDKCIADLEAERDSLLMKVEFLSYGQGKTTKNKLKNIKAPNK